MIGTGYSPLTMYSARPDSFIGDGTVAQIISESPFQSVCDEVSLSGKALETYSQSISS